MQAGKKSPVQAGREPMQAGEKAGCRQGRKRVAGRGRGQEGERSGRYEGALMVAQP